LCYVGDLVDIELDEVRAGKLIGEPVFIVLVGDGKSGEGERRT
jgi:hypothetical protein